MLYYSGSENKGADQLRSCFAVAKLICVFVFAYAKSRFLITRLTLSFMFKFCLMYYIQNILYIVVYLENPA